jgi:hypothetical protein
VLNWPKYYGKYLDYVFGMTNTKQEQWINGGGINGEGIEWQLVCMVSGGSEENMMISWGFMG